MDSEFSKLGLNNVLVKAVTEMGFVRPMPVQEQVIPYLLGDGNDVVALAQTGSGKTAAFGLPILQKTDVSKAVPQALILSPTRELCMQIAADLADFSKYMDGLHIVPMYGGTSVENQIRNFKKGAHIIVATPGRLLDLMNRGVVRLDTVSNVVLDEADEMLDMGFSDDLNAILETVPAQRNMLMFSATMSSEIASIAKNYLHDYKEIVIGNKNQGTGNVNHVYYMVHAKDKYYALKRIVDFYPKIYAIIFCRTRLETQEVADNLIQDGYNAEPLHGDLSQAQRDLTMNKFRKRQVQLLVATDVAARGLDVDDLTHVINYGLPDDIEVYTHRSGRTGRAGKTGTSISIINLREKGKLKQIEKTIAREFVAGTIPEGTQICEKQLYKVIDDIEKTLVNEEQIAPFLPLIYRQLDWLDKEDIIKRVVSLEFGKFMSYYANAPEIETVTVEQERKSRKEEQKKKEADRKERKRKAQEGYARFFINLGKLDNVHTSQIIDIINKFIPERIDLGRIDVMHSFSFFETPAKNVPLILEELNGRKLKGRELRVELAEEGPDNFDQRGAGAKKERRRDRNDRAERGDRGGRGAERGERRNDRSRREDRGGNDRKRNKRR